MPATDVIYHLPSFSDSRVTFLLLFLLFHPPSIPLSFLLGPIKSRHRSRVGEKKSPSLYLHSLASAQPRLKRAAKRRRERKGRVETAPSAARSFLPPSFIPSHLMSSPPFQQPKQPQWKLSLLFPSPFAVKRTPGAGGQRRRGEKPRKKVFRRSLGIKQGPSLSSPSLSQRARDLCGFIPFNVSAPLFAAGSGPRPSLTFPNL